MYGFDVASAAATRRTKNGSKPRMGRDMQQVSQEKNTRDECVNQNTYTMSIIVTVTVIIHRTIIRVIREYNLTA
ncbi:hypothetical protein DPMN_026888 [Dreissena polymorpha]|uniref:Uncharacterized protein n=1 Tax=Dreissena polymorpha TaxID=45954 RepID=A0A9D4RER6_DREPO|nr:hypothetical protein DPMN_026888 [Dreissena polymorpha]